MKTFEISFKYGFSNFTALVIRDEKHPDVICIKEPHPLHLPNSFTLSCTEDEINSGLTSYPGLTRRICEAIERCCAN